MISISGELDARGMRIGVVVSRFNREITDGLLEGATRTLGERGAMDVFVVSVPGAWEIPFAVRALASAKKLHAVVALGAVIRGETAHFEHVSKGAIVGCARAERDLGIPVALGILTTEDEAQAKSRSTGKDNKGIEAALAAIEMASLKKMLGPA